MRWRTIPSRLDAVTIDDGLADRAVLVLFKFQLAYIAIPFLTIARLDALEVLSESERAVPGG